MGNLVPRQLLGFASFRKLNARLVVEGDGREAHDFINLDLAILLQPICRALGIIVIAKVKLTVKALLPLLLGACIFVDVAIGIAS